MFVTLLSYFDAHGVMHLVTHLIMGPFYFWYIGHIFCCGAGDPSQIIGSLGYYLDIRILHQYLGSNTHK